MEQLQRLIQESGLEDQAACKDNILMLGNSLFEAFGINGGLETDYERGYEKAREFLVNIAKPKNTKPQILEILRVLRAEYKGTELFEKNYTKEKEKL